MPWQQGFGIGVMVDGRFQMQMVSVGGGVSFLDNDCAEVDITDSTPEIEAALIRQGL